jgi:hypothetical protein
MLQFPAAVSGMKREDSVRGGRNEKGLITMKYGFMGTLFSAMFEKTVYARVATSAISALFATKPMPETVGKEEKAYEQA